jgi:hypothetical protein
LGFRNGGSAFLTARVILAAIVDSLEGTSSRIHRGYNLHFHIQSIRVVFVGQPVVINFPVGAHGPYTIPILLHARTRILQKIGSVSGCAENTQQEAKGHRNNEKFSTHLSPSFFPSFFQGNLSNRLSEEIEYFFKESFWSGNLLISLAYIKTKKVTSYFHPYPYSFLSR